MATNKSKWTLRIKELHDKELITSENKETFLEMCNSKDEENFTILDILVKNIIKDKLSEQLNEGQKKAYYDIIDFIDTPGNHQAIVLKGYAGTGKTFLVKRLIEFIGQTEHEACIAISAPTNKAVKVLYKSAAGNMNNAKTQVFEDIFDAEARLTYSTIHKLLGLKQRITPDGKEVFDAGKITDSKLAKFKYLIVDEVSMLNDKLCETIMSFSGIVKIIFMGDPFQIPPINQKDSIPFRADISYIFKRVELTEIMRQKGDNPIINISFKIRENISVTQPIKTLETKLNDKNQGIMYYDSVINKDKIRPLLEQYFKTETFTNDSNYMKVIAWRNKTVDYINNVVRELLFGVNPSRFEIGEKLITQKPVFKFKESKKYGKYWKMFLNTSDECTITDISTMTFHKSVGTSKLTYDTHALEISYEDLYGEICFDTIHVIKDEFLADYKKFQDELKHIAKNSTGCAPKYRQKLWADYYDSRKWSANVIYNYAISAHKSQGSTYKNVLIIEDDIDCNKAIVERNRIKYTAYSRASDLLHVLRKNY